MEGSPTQTPPTERHFGIYYIYISKYKQSREEKKVICCTATYTRDTQTHLGPAAADRRQERTEVHRCLTDGPAGSEVVAGGAHADGIRGPRESPVRHLCPQVSCRSTWNREKGKGERYLGHGDVVNHGPQVGVSDDKHDLKQQTHCIRTETP